MYFVKKTWKDRLVEFANRRVLKVISGGTSSGSVTVDVERNEGTISQAGDAFSAANMNDLEQRIADGFASINNSVYSTAIGANSIAFIEKIVSGNTNNFQIIDYGTGARMELSGEGVVPEANAWTIAPIRINAVAETGKIPVGRAGISFHNQNLNAMYLYLDTDGRLHGMRNDGESITLLASPNDVFHITDNIIWANNHIEIRSTIHGDVVFCGSRIIARWIDGDMRPMYASAFNVESSKRYKNHISGMSQEEAEKLLKLRTVKFNYKSNPDIDCYGLYAEEVDEIMHYPVSYDSEGRPDALDYSKFVPYLIRLAQVQSRDIDSLKAEIFKIKKDLKMVQDKLSDNP